MADRGPRSVFDEPETDSPVPAGYGRLDDGMPQPPAPSRERKPFRWGRTWKDGEEPEDDGDAELDPTGPSSTWPRTPAPRPSTPVSYARTTDNPPDAPSAPPSSSPSRSGDAGDEPTVVAPPSGGAPAAPASKSATPSAPAGPSSAPAKATPTKATPTKSAPAGSTAAKATPTKKAAAPAAPSAPTKKTPVKKAAAPPVKAPVARREPEPEPEPEGLQPTRRSRIIPTRVPRRPLGADGRVLEADEQGTTPPEARPAAYLKETVRTRQVVRHVDTFTVFRMSLLFYFLGVISLLLAGVVLWNVASALGTIHSINKSIKTLFDLKSFTLHPLPTLGYAAAVGAVLIIFGTLVNVLATVIFNLISDVTGGVVVRVVAEPDDN